MDILKIIEKQIEEIKKDSSSIFLDVIYNHLDRADIYFNNGKKDDHYYNDVVYRTNQAFEGALKEAYKVLVNKTDEQVAKKTPNDIEQYLKENNVFKERILKLFENYRQQWRNKSTHDYKLVLDENEAFLALINVSSFVYLLLKQIQEKLAYDIESKREMPQQTKFETNKIVSKNEDSLVDKILKLLAVFIHDHHDLENLEEVEVIGRLNAFLQKANSKFIIHREFGYTIGNSKIRPDFIIEYETEKIILELKNAPRAGKVKGDIDQVASYLALTGLKNGILFFFNSKIIDNKFAVHNNKVFINEMNYNVYIVA